MKRRLTREERRRRSNRTLRILTYLCFVGLLAIWLIGFLALNVDADPPRPEHTKATMPEITLDELEAAENELIAAALIAKANRIDNCTVTWYTNDTCGKEPGEAGYGITASGLPTVEGLTCAVDNSVIPRYADVFVQFSDGTIEQYWATDTGVKGNHIDIFEPDYDTAIQNGRQTLTVWWIKENKP